MCDPVTALKQLFSTPKPPPPPELPQAAQMPKAAVASMYRRRNATGITAGAAGTQLTGPMGASPLAANLGRAKALGE